jgi:hypothetical protein
MDKREHLLLKEFDVNLSDAINAYNDNAHIGHVRRYQTITMGHISFNREVKGDVIMATFIGAGLEIGSFASLLKILKDHVHPRADLWYKETPNEYKKGTLTIVAPCTEYEDILHNNSRKNTNKESVYFGLMLFFLVIIIFMLINEHFF